MADIGREGGWVGTVQRMVSSVWDRWSFGWPALYASGGGQWAAGHIGLEDRAVLKTLAEGGN